MKKMLATAAAVCTLAFAGQASAAVIKLDFNDLTTPVTSYTKDGVTVTTEDGSAFGGYLLPNGTSGLFSSTTAFRFDFDVTAFPEVPGPNEFSLYIDIFKVGANGKVFADLRDLGSGAIVAGFGAAGIFPTGLAELGVGWANDTPLYFSAQSGDYAFDNLLIRTGDDYFQWAATPEPSTWAMLIMGFFGLGSVMRRRYATSAAQSTV